MERGIHKNEVISLLTRSTHRKFDEYVPMGMQAGKADPEFFGHLIAWNAKNGQIRDSKVALPVIAIASTDEREFLSNALAHLALLDPRNLARAVRFHHSQSIGHRHKLYAMVKGYLRTAEKDWPRWERLAVQFRAALKALYVLSKVQPHPLAKEILFERHYPKGSVFAEISNLGNLPAAEAAAVIHRYRLPSLVIKGVFKDKIKDNVDLTMALIKRMTPEELITWTFQLEEFGIRTIPELRAAYEEALAKATDAKKPTLKATRANAAGKIKDEGLKKKVANLQEKQLSKLSITGNWLVLGDKSPSMASAIEISRNVAATLARLANGDVHLVFFDGMPRYINATGMTYEALLAKTKHVKADGSGTSIGCGLSYLADRGTVVDGIAIVSDGEENTVPLFANEFKKYSERIGKEVPVYFYWTGPSPYRGDECLRSSMQRLGFDVQTFDLSAGVDYNSLPNLVQTMRTQRYSLIDEIMDTPLLKVEEVCDYKKKGEKVHA